MIKYISNKNNITKLRLGDLNILCTNVYVYVYYVMYVYVMYYVLCILCIMYYVCVSNESLYIMNKVTFIANNTLIVIFFNLK